MRTCIMLWFATAGLAACAGCTAGLAGDPADFIKPTVAVMKFENRAASALSWDLGTGMRDILVDRLVATQRYHVIERPELGSVIDELRLQNSGVTRDQDRARPGRLKNVRYLVKGTITDFGHVSQDSGFLGLPNMELLTGGSRAVMGLTLYVVDVESGEIISSESIEESVRASDVSVQAGYRDVAFGGSVFYRTPLGRATARVIDEAVVKVTRTIAARRWQPRIALVQERGTVVINGGRDRRVPDGATYEVYRLGSPIIDPDTGDTLGHQPGEAIGRIRIREVRDRYSVGTILHGNAAAFTKGQRCRRVESPAEDAAEVSMSAGQ